MKSKDIVRLFFTTLMIGAVSTLVTSFFVKADSYAMYLQPFNLFELFGLFVFFIALGFVFSLISQMGFFAYLTINQFGLGMFRGFWTSIQALLVLVTLFDLVYFQYKSENGYALYWYVIQAIVLFVYSWAVASIKAKETNRNAFIPALFFMVVVTTIEWVPGLRSSGYDYAWLMIFPLLSCNTYQLLVLHRLKSNSTNTNS